MNGLSNGAVEHLVPVMEIIIGFIVVVVATLGGLWGGFRWLRSQIRDEFHGLTKSDSFKKVVAGIIAEATAGWNDLNNRIHEQHRQGIADLRKRDEERAEAIKRLHGRIDSVWERVGGPK